MAPKAFKPMIDEILTANTTLFSVMTKIELDRAPDMILEIHKGKDPSISLKFTKKGDRDKETGDY